MIHTHTCKSIWLPSPNTLQDIRGWSTLPLKVVSHTQSILTLPPTDQGQTQSVRPPYQDNTVQLKSCNFTCKIKYDGINFAKNGRFEPIFTLINIKSHYLRHLNQYIVD